MMHPAEEATGAARKDKSAHSVHVGECADLLVERLRPRGLQAWLPQVMRRQRGLFRRRLPAEGTGRLTRQETASRYSGEHKDPIGYPDKHSGPLTAPLCLPALPCSSFSPVLTCVT